MATVQDAAMMLYLNPELVAHSNITSPEAAVAYMGTGSASALPSSMPDIPDCFDAEVFLASQPDTSGLNATIRTAMLAEGASPDAVDRCGQFVGTLMQDVNVSRATPANGGPGELLVELDVGSPLSFSACNLMVGDTVRLVSTDALRSSLTGVIMSIPSPRSFSCQAGAWSGGPTYGGSPLAYTLLGIKIWDAQRQARVGLARMAMAQGTGGAWAVLTDDMLLRPEFNDSMYRVVYPDARTLSTPDAYLDYRARWRRNAEYRVVQGSDLYNRRAPGAVEPSGSNTSTGTGSNTVFIPTALPSNLSVDTLDVRVQATMGNSNLVVTQNNAGLRSGLTAAGSNLVVTHDTVTIGGLRGSNLVVQPSGMVRLAGGSLLAGPAQPVSMLHGLNTGGSMSVACNVTVAGAMGLGLPTPDPATTGARLAVDGDIFTTGTLISLSDARAKCQVRDIDNPIQRVCRLRGVTFQHQDPEDEHGLRRHTGLIAQDVAEALPEALYQLPTRMDRFSSNSGTGTCTGTDPYHSVAYGNLAGLFAEAIKALHQRVEQMSMR